MFTLPNFSPKRPCRKRDRLVLLQWCILVKVTLVCIQPTRSVPLEVQFQKIRVLYTNQSDFDFISNMNSSILKQMSPDIEEMTPCITGICSPPKALVPLSRFPGWFPTEHTSLGQRLKELSFILKAHKKFGHVQKYRKNVDSGTNALVISTSGV